MMKHSSSLMSSASNATRMFHFFVSNGYIFYYILYTRSILNSREARKQVQQISELLYTCMLGGVWL
jgi:hypothetical protein